MESLCQNSEMVSKNAVFWMAEEREECAGFYKSEPSAEDAEIGVEQ